MPLSRYLVSFAHPDQPGWSAVFSTRKGSLCLLPDEVLDRLRRGEVPAALGERLTRLGVVGPDPGVERAQVLGYLDEVNRVSPLVTVAVILGMACNFACPYCYERGAAGGAMAPETAEALAAFAARRLGPGKTKLRAAFYGGETLLYRDRLRQVAALLRAVAAERGASWAFGIVTNGSLLTPKLVEELLPLGLTSVQVTLDGPPATHDRSRPFRDGRQSFGAIVENLRAVKGLVKVGLGGNYTEESWRTFLGLFDELAAEGLGPADFAEVRFCAAIPMVDGHGGGPEPVAGCTSWSEPWAAEAAVALRGETIRRGYPTPKPGPSPCMIDRDDAFTVDWDGSLTKCPGLVGRREFAVGDVWQGFADYRESHGVQAWRDEPACRECAYLPLCFGGCRFQRLQREGSLAGVDCQKPFFDATLEPMLRQELRYRHGAGPAGPPL